LQSKAADISSFIKELNRLAKDGLATAGPGYLMEKTEGDSDSEDESVNT
jgi:hypothetical protein